MGIELQFQGAAGEVTGSCHLLTVGTRRILLDCGQIQGGRDEDLRNALPFAFDASGVDALVLSHAHIDHCGRLPLLVKRGFQGRIHTTPATAQLLRIMLEDSLKLMLADTETKNRIRQRKGLKLLEPLFEPEDVYEVQRRLAAHAYGERFEVTGGVHCVLEDAGHILGSASVQLWLDDGELQRTVVFSGDIGPKGTPLIQDPTPVHAADLVLLESTYGDRLHRERLDTVHEIGEVLDRAWKAGGNVLIPAFAVGRSQELLYWFAQNYQAWNMQRFAIFLDSPMASKVVEVYQRNQHLFDDDARKHLGSGRNPFRLPNLQLVNSPEESRALNKIEKGAIIIAGSGMCNGGRIRHHLIHNLWRPQAHVLIPGYQAAGTLGRDLVDGKPMVRIFNEYVKVRAQIHTVGGLSAHADQAGLLAWYGHIEGAPPVYLVHGEDRARTALADKLTEQFGTRVGLARPGLRVQATADGWRELADTPRL